mmetsp:Transcript_43474/g.135240  ORF Transcript_43474/g.135240 Transcript_43474/m.135240 type:complete len:183 (+) Transcript_43474:89-637(+)
MTALGEPAGRPSNPLLNVTGLIFSIVVVVWQANVVGRYMREFPSSLWTGTTRHPLNRSCSALFFVMHWTVFLTFFVAVIEALMLCMRSVCCVPCLGACAVVDFIAQVSKAAFLVWGFVTILSVDGHQPVVGACNDLWVCAWWTYLGFLLASLAVGCFCCCCCGHLFVPKHPNERTPLNAGSA